MKLATQIIAFTLATVVLLTIAASYFTIHSAYEEFEIQQHDTANRVGAAMRPSLERARQEDGAAGIARVLDPHGPAGYLGMEVRWVWFDERTPAATRPELPPEQWPKNAGQPPVSIIASAGGQRQIHTYVPVQLTPDRLGGLELTESLASLDRLSRREIWVDLIALSLIAAVSVGIAYMTGVTWIGRPLQALVTKTQRIGDGDFAHPLQLKTYNELGVLAGAINDMCGRLTAQQERIRAETQQRLAALEQLRHADRLNTVGRLAAGIAHEMGTPLNVVAGRAGLIASGRLSSDEVKASATTIKGEADRITVIVRQLLDFARRRPPKRAPEDLHALANHTCKLLQPLAQRHQVRLELSEPAEQITASVDGSQLTQVLTNLLVNAFQAMPGGGAVKLDVTSGAHLPNGSANGKPFARISICDEGTGISAKHLEHIFEPFFTTKDVGQGTGLGLSIAYGIIQEDGGEIAVESHVGEGTRFVIYLPAEASP